MEHHNKILGVYLSADHAAVVLLGCSDSGFKVFDCFTAQALAPDEQQGGKSIAAVIAETVRQKNIGFSAAAVALDCRLYSQQSLHSGFKDAKQISKTVAFDAEESLAADAAEMAVAFEIISQSESGSDLNVFASGKQKLHDIILDMAVNKLDPVTVEPDVIGVRRLCEQLGGDSWKSFIWAMISNHNCYIISPAADRNKPLLRTFLTNPSQNKTGLLSREIMITAAAGNSAGLIDGIKMYDSTGTIDAAAIERLVSLKVESVDIPAGFSAAAADPQQCPAIEMICAAGAAMGQLIKSDTVDFRPAFMPYQGKKIIVETTIMAVSVMATIVIFALGLYLQLEMFKTNQYRAKLDRNLRAEYALAMPGQKFPSTENPVSKLTREISKIKSVKAGQFAAEGEDSVAAQMTYLLEAFNETDKTVDLEISSITVSQKDITIAGSTNTGGHLKLFEAIDKHQKLQRQQFTYQSKNDRDSFRMTINSKKQGEKE